MLFKQDNKTIFLWLLAALLFALVASLALVRAWPLLFPEVARTLPPAPACDLAQAPCRIRFEEGAVTFSLVPRGIPLMTPLQLDVRLEGLVAQRVQVDFVGLGMEMGLNRPALKQVAPGHFVGQGTLPVCSQEQMQWQARLMIDADQGLIVAPFEFSTRRASGH